MTLEDIGEGKNALVCITNLTTCCRPPYTDPIGIQALGNWFFPNGTRVSSSGNQWDFHRTREQMVVPMHRRRGGEDGIYHCVIPVTTSIDHTVYIGVYTATTGKPSPTKCGCYASYTNNFVHMHCYVNSHADLYPCTSTTHRCTFGPLL